MVRFIAFYLPQFHPIKENDEWWGKGFTEWTNVAKAKPLFRGHQQPNIPADLGFYDLRMPEIRKQQAQLAREYGIEGFCYWHYWFGNGKRLLDTPFTEIIKTKDPDFPFCLAWANHSWEKKQFDAKGTSEVLMVQTYPGEEDYKNHFNTMLSAFKDKRYIKVEGKLLFIIYAPTASPEIRKFMHTWQTLAQEIGLNGFYFVARDAASRKRNELLEYGYDATYNDDVFNIHHESSLLAKVYYRLMRRIFNKVTVFLYKDAIKYMVSNTSKEENCIPVIAPNWDHSPRSSGKGIILHKSHPKYFKAVVKKAIEVVRHKPAEKQLVLIKAWNEWGEGNYMEPDLRYGKGNLEALKTAIEESKVDIDTPLKCNNPI